MMATEVLFFAGLIAAVDQASKKIVEVRLASKHVSLVRSLVRIRYVRNPRGSFGLARNRLALLLIWGCIALGIIFTVWQGQFFQTQVAQLGLGAALGGATSNLLDRLWRGAVIDFIDVGFWPVFNLADTAIVGGVVVALVFMR